MAGLDIALHRCDHSRIDHLFRNPLCKTQPLLKRIMQVVFNILTLGVPAAIYHITSCCFPRRAHEENHVNLQEKGIAAVLQNLDKPYSQPEKEALEFAKKELESHPRIKMRKVAGKHNLQPINSEITKLVNLYWDVHFKKFTKALKKNAQDPWSREEVIQPATACMKIAYAISALTLEDLSAFTEMRANKGDNITYAEALKRQDSYQYRTFYYCTNIYHNIRGAVTFNYNKHQKEHVFKYPAENDLSDAYTNLFYQEGTIQNTFNSLYNSYCDRVRLYVNEEDLRKADPRHVNWTQKDELAADGKMTFVSIPDTQPT